MSYSKYIFLLITISLSSYSTIAQTRKETKNKLDSIINFVTKAEHSTLDSLINHIKTDNNASTDTSFQVVEETLKNGEIVQMIIIDGDTSYIYNMATFSVVDLRPYGDKEKDKKFRRLRYHVKKVYPYAKLASKKLNFYNEELMKVKSKRKRRKL